MTHGLKSAARLTEAHSCSGFFVVNFPSESAKMKCGGTSTVKPADPEIQGICESVKEKVEEKANKKYATFEAKSYTTQVVAGTNYFVKVHVGGDDHVHLRIFKGLPHTGGALEVHGLQESKTPHEPIEYF